MSRVARKDGATAFVRVFSDALLRTLAGARSFERGELYAARGRVQKLRLTANDAEATVRGTDRYKVRLWVEDNRPRFRCSCPVGVDGAFCKHCVAVALAAVGDRTALAAVPDGDIDLRAQLRCLDHDRLLDLVIELSASDELLRARLELEAAGGMRHRNPREVRQLKRAIDDAIVTRDFVSWREAYSYAANVHATLEVLRRLLDEGSAEVVIELAGHALRRLEEAVGSVDDSNGELGGIAAELQHLHLQACVAARPEPVTLARRLFEWELNAGDLDIFSRAAHTYAHVLGGAGSTEYRRLAEAEWAQVPRLAPGDHRSFTGKRFRVTHIMEAFAEASGDVDEMVAVLARDQSSPWQFVRIAEKLREHGRHGDAQSWAERGVAAFGPSADMRLIDLLADLYCHAGRADDAVALAWQVFDEVPSPATYRRLARQAQEASAWDSWRARGLERLRTDIGRRGAERRTVAGHRPVTWWPSADASDLVEVLLWEGETEQAWIEAKAGGCSDALWQELAMRREGEHPREVVPIWQAQVERWIDMKRNDAYVKAVEVMEHVAALMRAAGEEHSFANYAASVKARHKTKRNLVRLFDARSW